MELPPGQAGTFAFVESDFFPRKSAPSAARRFSERRREWPRDLKTLAEAEAEAGNALSARC